MKLNGNIIRSRLARKGLSVRKWARTHNLKLNEKTVYAVLAGDRSGSRSPNVIKALKEIAT